MKLHDGSDRRQLAVRLRAEFEEAGVDAQVGIPADRSAEKWDLSVVVEAASTEAWHSLARTPAIATIYADLAARAEVTKAWTFDVGEPEGELDDID
ncbi:MAG: hypothetical protein QM831_28910 [Kofleriaceae bacterium]